MWIRSACPGANDGPFFPPATSTAVLLPCVWGFGNPKFPSCPRAWRLWSRSKLFSSSPLSSLSLSTGSTAEGGRSLHESDLSAGESYDKKNDSHPLSFWSDLHTGRPEGLCGSQNCYVYVPTPINKECCTQPCGLGPLPVAGERGHDEKGLQAVDFCIVWAFLSDLKWADRIDAEFNHVKTSSRQTAVLFPVWKKK